MKKAFTIIVLTALVSSILSGCTLSSQQAWANWQDINNLDNAGQVKAWQEDLDYLASNLEKKHKNLYHTIDRETFKSEVKKLSASIGDMDSIRRFVEIKKLVAKVGDGHTSIRYDIPLNWFPVMLYPFDDGLYVIASGKEYEHLLGKRLTKVGGSDIDQVFETMKVMISHDNEVEIKTEFPFIVKCADFLNYFGYIDNISEGQFTFEDKNRKEENIILKSYFHKEAVEMSYLEEKNAALDKLLYRQNVNEIYWYRYLANEKTVYFNYNRCHINKNKPIKEFTNELLSFIDNNEVEKFIFDIRNNGGGDSRIIEPLIEGLSSNEKLSKTGSLFVVIGNSTYSSAILNALSLKNHTKAIFIGQPTGGRPNHYGEVKRFNLPNTGLLVNYSTKYFEHSKVDTESLFPDINVKYTFDDYCNGIDPVMEAIKTMKNQ
jgi:hypothetical protein